MKFLQAVFPDRQDSDDLLGRDILNDLQVFQVGQGLAAQESNHRRPGTNFANLFYRNWQPCGSSCHY